MIYNKINYDTIGNALMERPMTYHEACNPPKGKLVVKYHESDWYKENCFADDMGDYWLCEEDWLKYEAEQEEKQNTDEIITDLKCILHSSVGGSRFRYVARENIEEEMWGIVRVVYDPNDYPEEWI